MGDQGHFHSYSGAEGKEGVQRPEKGRGAWLDEEEVVVPEGSRRMSRWNEQRMN